MNSEFHMRGGESDYKLFIVFRCNWSAWILIRYDVYEWLVHLDRSSEETDARIGRTV